MKRVILDTDIGTDVDDALALTLAAASPELRLEGITTVHADAPLRARIARRLLKLANRDEVPVVAGASLPIQIPLPEKFHWNPRLRGHEGLGILSAEELIPSPDPNATADDAARFIIEKAAAHRHEVSLITVGPLTNVARALQLEPRLADWIPHLTLMGGLIDTAKSDWPPMLETNLNADPAAAEIVFASRIPLTIVPIEVTTQVYLSSDQRAGMRAWRRPLAHALVSLMEQMQESFANFSQEVGVSADIFQGRTYMHDPLAVYASMESRFVTVRRMHVQLEVHGRVLRTIPYPNRAPNVRVCIDVDAPEFVSFWLSQVRDLVAREECAEG